MRVLLISLLCVTTAAVETTEAAFPVPTWYAATNYTPPQVEVNALQGLSLNEADWVAPPHLGSWRKTADGRPAPCWTNQQLVDEGGCDDLTKIENITTAEVCAKQCEEEPLCPSYQFSTNKGCFMGSGKKCGAARAELVNLSASRFMSGKVMVLMNTYQKGIQIMKLSSIGHFKDANGTLPTVTYGIERCKEYCYSNLLCQYWQFFGGEGAGKGCWVDDGNIEALRDGKLTKNDDWKDKGEEPDLKAGEFIQHYCPPKPPQAPPPPPPTTTPAPPPDLTWLWITLGVIAAAILAGILYYLLKPKPKVRAVKPKPPPPAKEPVPVYRTVIPAYGVPSPATYQGTSTAYTGDPRNPQSFVVTRAA